MNKNFTEVPIPPHSLPEPKPKSLGVPLYKNKTDYPTQVAVVILAVRFHHTKQEGLPDKVGAKDKGKGDIEAL